MKNIGFAKIGKSIKLKTNNYSPIGGDNEPSAFLRALANNNPDKTFYIVGRSDFSTLSETERLNLFPYDNVIDIWKGVKSEKTEKFYRHIINYFKDKKIQLDFTVMMVGQVGTVTVPNKIIKTRNDDGIPAAVIDMTKFYTSPISVWINEDKPRYIEIVNDPRYVMNQSRDIFHLPEISLGQYDYEYRVNCIESYEDQTRKEVYTKSKYAGMEVGFCMDYKYTEEVNIKRNINFMMILNEGKPSRYSLLKEWVLDEIDDVEIYGRWEDDRALTDHRFRGSLHIDEIQRKLNNVKFTFIIPIKKGWVTAKYLEMIHAGVIPFFHPTYDEQRHLQIPDFLRVNSAAEMKEKMERLINNENEYVSVLKGLRKLILKPEYYDGTFLNKQIMSAADPSYVAPNKEEYEKKTAATLEEFFA